MAKSIGELRVINQDGDSARLDKDTKFLSYPKQNSAGDDGIYDRAVKFEQLMYYIRQVIAGQEMADNLDIDTPAADLAGLDPVCSADDLVSALNKLGAALGNEAETRENADTTLQSNIDAETTRAVGVEGSLSALETTIKTNLVAAINSEKADKDAGVQELNNIIGDPASPAPGTLRERLDAAQYDIQQQQIDLAKHKGTDPNPETSPHPSVIGTLANLQTTDNGNLVAAINSVLAKASETIQTDEQTLEGDGSGDSPLRVAPRGIDTAHIADLAVTQNKLETPLSEKIDAAATQVNLTAEATAREAGDDDRWTKAESDARYATAEQGNKADSAIQQAGLDAAITTHNDEPAAHGIDVVKTDIQDLQAKTGLDLPAAPTIDGEYKLVIAGGTATWETI